METKLIIQHSGGIYLPTVQDGVKLTTVRKNTPGKLTFKVLNDDTLDLAHEVVRCDALSRVHIGLDYFDASINRIGAYVIGSRATQKCFLQALLEPLALLRKYEAEGRFFERLALLEECKSLPWNAVWDYFCLTNDVPVGEDYIADIEAYEKNVTSKRQ